MIRKVKVTRARARETKKDKKVIRNTMAVEHVVDTRGTAEIKIITFISALWCAHRICHRWLNW